MMNVAGSQLARLSYARWPQLPAKLSSTGCSGPSEQPMMLVLVELASLLPLLPLLLTSQQASEFTQLNEASKSAVVASRAQAVYALWCVQIVHCVLGYCSVAGQLAILSSMQFCSVLNARIVILAFAFHRARLSYPAFLLLSSTTGAAELQQHQTTR